ncbi:transcription antitermination factor NusB [Motilibacter aurantiacus]|uniref:transcription antitermination factor NusB n=1 Tax=Motilibacter aurantiacus TaxID=2714955 RepID=UPI00140740A1|nr:transcription antitermination factor NusB [Motilibacter aurantiacus]
MSARHKARKRALDVLFEAEQRGRDPLTSLAEHVSRGEPPVSAYAVELVEGVAAHREAIDAVLARHAQGWELDRMPAVDRNVLRIAVYELLHRDDIPGPVAVAEAVALVSELSTDESPGFVNGLLGTVLGLRPQLSQVEPQDS